MEEILYLCDVLYSYMEEILYLYMEEMHLPYPTVYVYGGGRTRRIGVIPMDYNGGRSNNPLNCFRDEYI